MPRLSIEQVLRRFRAVYSQDWGANLFDAEKVFMAAEPAAACLLADEYGGNLLLYAASQHRFELAERLVRVHAVGREAFLSGPIVDSTTGATPLHLAALDGDVEMCRLLLDSDPCAATAINGRECCGFSALHMAAYKGSVSVVELLLERGGRVNRTARGPMLPPAASAVIGRNSECLAKLIEAGADLTRAPGWDTRSVLEIAVGKAHHLELAIALANNAFGSDDRNILVDLLVMSFSGYDSWSKPSRTTVSMLLAAGADMMAPFGSSGKCPLIRALESAPDSVVARMLDSYWDSGQLVDVLEEYCTGDGISLLSQAIERDAHLAWALVTEGAPIDIAPTPTGTMIVRETPLSRACVNKNYRMASKLLRAGVNPNIGPATGSALVQAARQNDLRTVQLLLEYGAGPNTPESWVPALSGAIYADSQEIADTLLEAGASLDALSPRGFGPFITYIHGIVGETFQYNTTIGLNLTNCFKALVRRYGSRQRGVDGETVLHFAASKGSYSDIEFLVEVGKCEVDSQAFESSEYPGMTPLMVSCLYGNSQAARCLLDKGASVAISTGAVVLDFVTESTVESKSVLESIVISGMNAFLCCIPDGFEECARQLVAYGGVDPTCTTRAGGNALSLAMVCWTNQAPNVRKSMLNYLVNIGVSVASPDFTGRTPVCTAAQSGDIEGMALLCSFGADISCRTRSGKTPLHFLSVRQNCEALRRAVMDLGADVNAASNRGSCPLHWAAGTGLVANCEELIYHGANPQAVDDNGATPLILACGGRQGVTREGSVVATVRALLEAGADVAAKTKRGLSSLHFAARTGRADVCRLLLLYGADLHSKTTCSGRSPLFFAVQSDDTSVIAFLVSKGARINDVDLKNRTPLYLAACEGRARAVSVLLEFGADTHQRSRFGRTALEAARRRKQLGVLRAFHRAKAQGSHAMYPSLGQTSCAADVTSVGRADTSSLVGGETNMVSLLEL